MNSSCMSAVYALPGCRTRHSGSNKIEIAASERIKRSQETVHVRALGPLCAPEPLSGTTRRLRSRQRSSSRNLVASCVRSSSAPVSRRRCMGYVVALDSTVK